MAVTIEMTSEDQKVFASVGKLEAKIKHLEGRLRDVGKTGEAGTAKVTGGMDRLGSSVGRIQQLIGAAGIGAAFGAGLRAMAADADAAVESLRRVEAAARSFGQIAETPEQFRFLRLKAQELAISEGIPEEAASRIAFQAQSGGILGAVNQLTRAAVGLNIDPAALTSAIVTMQAGFGAEAGTPMDIANRLLAGAKRTKLDVTQLAGVAAIPGTAAAQIGAGSAEVLSLVAALTGPNVGPETAAQRVKAAAEEIRRAGFGGAGVLGGLEAFRGAAPELFAKRVAGRAEFAEAVELIRKMGPEIELGLAEIAGATKGVTPIQRGLAIVATDPELRKARELRREEIAADIERRQLLGPEAMDINLGRVRYETAQRRYQMDVPDWQRGIVSFLGMTERAGLRAGELLFGPQYMAGEYTKRAMELRQGAGEEGLMGPERMLADIRAQLEEINASTGQVNTKTRPPALQTPLGRPSTDDGGDVKWN